jgi:hypothetical protein
MFLSLLLSVIALNPVAAPDAATGPSDGYLAADVISPDRNCGPGAICGSATVHGLTRCFFNNYYNGVVGGTPLTIDVTQTGTSTVYVYWVNATNKTIGIKGTKVYTKYHCV